MMSLAGWPAAAQAPLRDAAAPRPGEELPGLSIGPLTVRPGVELGRAGVDSNILRQAGAGVRDTVATAGGHLDVEMRVRPLRLLTANSLSYDYFARHPDQRAVNRAHLLQVEALLNRVSVFTSGSFLTSRDRFNYDLESRVRRTETSVSLGSELRLTAKTVVGVEVRRSDVSFDGRAQIAGIPVRALMQHRRHAGTASVRLSVTRLTSIVVRAEAGEARFTHSPERNSKSVRIMPAVEFGRSALLSGAAAVGYESFTPASTLFPRFTGVVGAADVSLPLPAEFRLRLGAARDLEYSFRLEEPLYLLSAASASVTRRMGDRWQVEVGAASQRLSYLSLTTGGRFAAGRDGRADRRLQYHAALRCQVTPLLRVGLESEFAHRRSPLRARRFEQLQAGVSLVYGF